MAKDLKTVLKIAAQLDPSFRKSFGDADEQVKKFGRNSAKAGAKASNAVNAKGASQKINAFGNSVTKAGDKLQHIGSLMAPVSAAATAVIGGSIKMANDYDNGMAKVNTIAELSSSKLKGLSKDLLQVSNDTGKSATEISEAAYQSLSASVPTDQVTKFTKVAANLGKAGFADTASSVDVLTTAINAYGLKTSEASKLSDMLINTQNKGKTTVAQLASQMGNVIPTASALNVNMANLSTGYVQLTKQGINTATATTQLRAMFNELSKSGTTVDKTLKKKTGKSFSDLMKSGESLGDVLGILQKSVKGNQTEFKNLWSNTRAGSGALAIVNAGTDEFNNQLKNMNNATGTTADALKKLQTPGALAKKSINQLKNSGIELGETFLDAAAPTIEEVAKGVGDLTTSFNKLDQPTRNAIAKGALLAAAASPVTIGFGKVVSFGGKVISTVSKIGSTFEKVKSIAGGVGTISSTVQVAGDAAQSATKALKGTGDALEGIGGTSHAASKAIVEANHSFSQTGKVAETTATQVGTLSSGLSAGAVAAIGVTAAAVVGLSAIMIAHRKEWQSTAKAVSSTGDSYNKIASSASSLATASNATASAAKNSMSALNGNGKVAEGLASKIRSLSKVENKSASQKQELKSAVSALNKVVPNLNLKYDEEKDKLSESNKEIQKNIDLLKQQQIQKTATAQTSKLESKQSELMIQQQKNQLAITEKQKEYNKLSSKVKYETAKVKYGENSPQAIEAQKQLSKYSSKAADAAKQLDRLKSSQNKLNKSLSNVGNSISQIKFTSALAQAKAAGKEIPNKLASGIKSTMTVLPSTEKELTNTVKYKDVITKAEKAGAKIPQKLSQEIISKKITVKQAQKQLAGVITFSKIESKAKKAGVKIPKSLSNGVNSGKMSAKQASDRLNEVIKFNKAVKTAKRQGKKIPKGLAKAVASGKLTAQQASQKIGNALTSKLNKSKEARSKGNKTNSSFSKAIGQTAAPSSAGRSAANAGVKPFKKVPGRVSNALSSLGTKIASAFKFTPPHIKTPHFSTSGKLSVGKGGVSVPKIHVSWYKNGGIMTKPTLFGMGNGHALAGGEAGPEGIIPLNKFWRKLQKFTSGLNHTTISNTYSTNTVNSVSMPKSSDYSRTVRNMDAINSSIQNIKNNTTNSKAFTSVNSHSVSNVLSRILSNSSSVNNMNSSSNYLKNSSSLQISEGYKNLTNLVNNGNSSNINSYSESSPFSETGSLSEKVERMRIIERAARGQTLGSMIGTQRKGHSRRIDISGITFSPKITITGSAAKEDVIEALRESQDEFKDFLKQLVEEEEDASYA